MRLTFSVLVLCSLLTTASIAFADDGSGPPREKLLLLGFKGTDAKLIKTVAKHIEAEYGLETEVLSDTPAPSKKDRTDNRPKVLAPLAQKLGIETGRKPNWKKIEKAIRKALKKIGSPQAKEILGYLDVALKPQYSVEVLAEQAAKTAGDALAAPGVVGVLAITDEDVTGQGMNFLFGWVNGELHAGIMSYCRFKPGAKKARLVDRAVKQALSSTGFVLGIPRCKTASCARTYPNSLAQHDKKPDKLCSVCLDRVAKRAAGR